MALPRFGMAQALATSMLKKLFRQPKSFGKRALPNYLK
jgi:hypothetical protein